MYVLHCFWSEHSRNSLTVFVDDHLCSAMCVLQAVSLRAKELELTSLFDHMGKEVVEEEEEEDLRHHSLTLPSQKWSVFSKLLPGSGKNLGYSSHKIRSLGRKVSPWSSVLSTLSPTHSQLTPHALPNTKQGWSKYEYEKVPRFLGQFLHQSSSVLTKILPLPVFGHFKGTVARDFLASIFFMDLLYMGPRFWGCFLLRFHEVIRIFRWIRSIGYCRDSKLAL